MGAVFAGRYELVDPLGEGGSGVVWRVWDHRNRDYLAAKVLRQVDAASLIRFMREQSMRIDHPHVLTPLGWAGEDDQVLLTMPIVRGGSVATLVGDFGALPAALSATLTRQLLVALQQIHSQGVVHRDVKPANLLLDATGRGWPHLRLSDFGVAAGVDEPRLTIGPVALGTPGFLAPESLQPGWMPDPRADLYAAGRCLIEMAGGEVPDRLSDAVTALTEFDPQRRVVSATAALELLDATGLVPTAEDDSEVLLGEVEVFDQVPALPGGWTPEGPETNAARTGRIAEPVSTEAAAAEARSGEQMSEPASVSADTEAISVTRTPADVPLDPQQEVDTHASSGVPAHVEVEPDVEPRTSGSRAGLLLALMLMLAGAAILGLTVYLAVT